MELLGVMLQHKLKHLRVTLDIYIYIYIHMRLTILYSVT